MSQKCVGIKVSLPRNISEWTSKNRTKEIVNNDNEKSKTREMKVRREKFNRQLE